MIKTKPKCLFNAKIAPNLWSSFARGGRIRDRRSELCRNGWCLRMQSETHKQTWHYYQINAKSSGAHYKWGLYLRLLNLLKCWPLKWAKTGMWDRIFLYTQWWEQFLRKTKNWQHGLTYKKELVIRIKLAPWKLKWWILNLLII